VLKDILEETYGVIVYQEQVMQIANAVAGYSLGEADLLRRAMGKKKQSEMEAQRERFVKGALERGYPKKKVVKLFDLMEQFAGYGFNKSHSAAYGFVAYVTAYLKAHYPVFFMGALLSSESGNTDKVVRYINECRDMGITILPPDFNESDWDFAPAGETTIRFGLGAIKNVGKSAVRSVIEAREQEGHFRSLFHFCEKVDWKTLNKRMLESAIKAGAMDSFGGHRAQLTAGLDRAIEAGQKAFRDRSTGQTGLFAAIEPEAQHGEDPLPDVPEWEEKQKLSGEKEMLGFYVTGHPLNAYRDKVEELASHSTAKLADLEQNQNVAVCGMLSSIARKRNREGRHWAAATLEDLEGKVDLLIFANQYEGLAPMLTEDQAVLVRGGIRSEEGAPPKLSVSEIVPLDVARVAVPAQVSITLRLGNGNGNGSDTVERLHELCTGKPGDTDVRLRLLRSKDFLVFYDIAQRVYADRDFRRKVEEICGQGSLEVMPR
jgi:DNA polymerase-3 subunit alpha